MKRLVLCLALAFAPQCAMAQTPPAPAGEPAPAPSAADPLTIVRRIYFPGDAKGRDWPYSARLTKLQEAAEATSRKIGMAVAGLDFAYHVNGNNSDTGFEKSVRIAPRRNDGKQARVRVSLRNFRNVELVYELVFENGRWAIDEVRSIREPRWALSRLYIIGAKEQ